MPTLGERVDIIEKVLATFMAECTKGFARIEEGFDEIRALSARTDRHLLALQQQADLDRAKAEKDREMDRARAEQDREKADKERRDFNRRLAELSDNQGLLIENMVWPNLPHIGQQVFGGALPVHTAIRIVRRAPGDKSRTMELDLIAVGGNKEIIICEAKTKVTVDKVKDFLASLERFREFFPEYADHKIHPMLASIYIDPGVVTYMTKNHVLALGFGGETMDLLNPEAVAA